MRMSMASSGSMAGRRRIGVITTSRADYSHLYWPLRELASQEAVELGVFALGPHLSPEFGLTIGEIERDGFPIVSRIECLLARIPTQAWRRRSALRCWAWRTR